MFVRIYLLPFLLVGLLFNADAQSSIPRLDEVDVQHYRFSLTLSEETDQIQGSALLSIRFLKDLPEFYLDLAGPQGGRGMTVARVLENEMPAPFRQEGERLHITPNDPLAAGEIHEFRIDYAGTPADGLIISENQAGQRTFFGDNWPNRAHHWLPTVDHPSDKATVEFIITAPDHYQVVGNGLQIEETILDAETKLTHWKETAPLPTKVMVIGAAPFAVQYVGKVQNIPVTSWVFLKDRTNGFYDYAQATYVLNYFIEKIGPYPYDKLANVQSKTRYGGMENAGCIFYAESSVTGRRDNEDLIAHEVAHQWFGNSASEGNWFDIWLSEGFATYLADLYWEHRYGRDAFVARLQNERATVLAYARRNAAPVIDTTVTDYNRLLTPNAYQKGAWVLHMLRRRLGDEPFWESLRSYYQRYKRSNAVTADFRKVVEDVTGRELEDFFHQWLRRPGHPKINVTWRYEDGKVAIALTQNQPQGPFQFPLDIALLDEAGQTLAVKTFVVEREQHTFEIPINSPPAGLQLDPDTWLLFEGKVKP